MINIGIPAIIAGVRAYHNGKNIKKAVMQAVFGGCFMHQGFKRAPKLQEKNAMYAWQTKLLINIGASLAESAGDEFVFRMDIGPVWLIAKDDQIRFKPAISAMIAPLVHFSEGSKLDWKRSLKYGTLAFEKEIQRDGTLSGSDGALAYSNANTLTTNANGSHAGHELVHTFQYRRDNIYPLSLSSLVNGFEEKLDDKWVDDTAWAVNWAAQCTWSKVEGKNRDFDIPLEKEAYYLENKYRMHER